jgi:predicted RNase H-like nuclease (RuvC/YqgF family)
LQGRLQDIIKPLRELADADMPGVVQSLDGVRRQSAAVTPRNEALAAALKQQEATIEKMKQVLALMVKSEGYQEAVNLLYEIQKSQTEVLKETIKEQQERIKKILEGTKPEGAKPDEAPKP